MNGCMHSDGSHDPHSSEGNFAPGTPTHEPNLNGDSAELDNHDSLQSYESQTHCREDLSGAALLINNNLASQAEQLLESQKPQQHSKKRKVFEKGNYNRYYGYRLAEGEEEDSRLQVMQKRWFVNKRCLDIGCNSGQYTLAVTQKFLPSKMLGIDIDENLAMMASQNLSQRRHLLNTEIHEKRISPSRRRSITAQISSLAHTWFQRGDILTSALEAGSFDTIMCMSVTKWIHLHGGDEIMRQVFRKVQDLLSPGGHFVVEPQPWKSYKNAIRKLKLQDADHVPLSLINFKPESFPEFLTQNLGFRLIESLVNPSLQTGFQRPIYCFRKV